MIPMKMVALKKNVGNNSEDCQRNALLYDLQLYQRKGTSITDKAQTIGWYLTAILEERNAPGKDNDANEGPVTTRTCLLTKQVS